MKPHDETHAVVISHAIVKDGVAFLIETKVLDVPGGTRTGVRSHVFPPQRTDERAHKNMHLLTIEIAPIIR